MRAVCLKGGFGIENLRVEERVEPSCGPHHILIRVKAASLNARDLMMARGEYNPRQDLPLVLGSEEAGEIVESDSQVSEWSVGDRIAPFFAGPLPSCVAIETGFEFAPHLVSL